MADTNLDALARNIESHLSPMLPHGEHLERIAWVQARLGEAVAESEANRAHWESRVEEVKYERDAAEIRATRAEAELKARADRIAEIKGTWGHVEGKEGCQCPICRRDLDAYLDWAFDLEYELYGEGEIIEKACAALADSAVASGPVGEA